MISRRSATNFAEGNSRKYMESWGASFEPVIYCDSFVSRPEAVDPKAYPASEYFTPQWQRVLSGRRVLLVRWGANQTRRLQSILLCLTVTPSVSGREIKLSDSASNMFREYTGLRDKIIDEIQLEELDVVLISLGPTVTVLAAKRSCRGFTAIDVGQFGGNLTKDEGSLSLYNSINSFLG